MLKRNMVEIIVLYSDLGYVVFEEVAKMDVLDLVSKIGGILGLFLGMSFLSLIEIIDIFLQILLKSRNKRFWLFWNCLYDKQND